MKKLLLSAATLLALVPQARASGLYYGYGRIAADYEWYGRQRESVGMGVHEFAFVDSSGAFRAAIESDSNRLAAKHDAEATARQNKTAPGTVIGYSWQKAAAREGDSKRYGLRLGSDEGLNFTSVTGGERGKHLLAYGEVSMLAAVWGSDLFANDAMLLMQDVVVGVHWGSLKHYGRPGNDDLAQNRDGGYFYIPVSYRLTLATPYSVRFIAEYGIDPITSLRIFAFDNEDLTHDRVARAAVEYRYDPFAVGLRYERYMGSFTWSDKPVKNPVYSHTLVGAYVAAGM